MTDQALLDAVQRAVIEPPDEGANWPSGLWTPAEVLGYLNQRQQRFLQETLVAAGWVDLPLPAATPILQLPDAWLATLHAMTDIAGQTAPITGMSRTEADLLIPDWPQSFDRPLGYTELQTGTVSWQLLPPALQDGTLHLFGSWLAQTLDGSGIDLGIPDELAIYLFYGTLADMLGKQGRAYDEPRRAYCEERWEEGIAVGRAMVEAIRVNWA